jgi:Protein of unknown function (DUF1553)/Protein of unknown function (DUF1549)/Planctomycete cytochrome C
MSTTPTKGRALLAAGLALAASLTGAIGTPARAGDVDYLRDVKPILARRCVACHGVLTHRAGLRLDTAAGVLKGGDSGPAVVAGNLEESPLIDAVTGSNGLRMPPEGEGEPVPAEVVATLRAWVVAGAPRPAHEPEPDDPRAHWAFRAPVGPPVPKVRNAAWVRNPVDAFLAARHDARGLTAVGPAERGELLRRVYLDLTGIAPSPAERRAFLDDPAPDAYEKVVDRLLSSPRYGERWGRHWMDVWRYSDWDGFGAEVRESQPHIWRWRDWIVESLNADKGYDRMVVEMLAADEAAPGDESAARATGYLVRSWYKFNRNVWLDSIIEHTSKAFLGITLNCARCHDHKYDPIAQREYYRFRALFEPHEIRTDRVPGQSDTAKSGLVRVFDAKPEAPTFLFIRGDEKEPDKDHPLKPGLPAILAGKAPFEVRPVSLPLEASRPGLRRFVAEEELARAKADVAAREAELAKAAKGSPAATQAASALAAARASLTATEGRIAAERARAATPPSPDADLLARLAAAAERRAALLVAEDSLARADAALLAAQTALKAKPADANLKKAVETAQAQQAAAAKSREAARTALAMDDAAYTPLGPVYPATSTGRRLSLARWIVSRQNPTAARVAVNHVWMRHFGAPLVPTVTDFGLNGKPPTHPELLDWLAVELMERGWSLKALHRLIVTSNAYRMRSTADASPGSPNLAVDPSNRDLWRMNPRRMEAEAVRDNVLAASGRLIDAMGGPDLDPESGLTDGRRSLYFRHTKEKRVTFLRLFDSASVTSCYRRGESVVPQQALALANSSLVRDQARVLAGKLSSECAGAKGDADSAFIAAVFARILGREATGEEAAECVRYLKPQPGAPASRLRESLVHVLFNHNDFVTIR